MLERRDISGTEVRAEKNDAGKVGKLSGLGVVYNSLSVDLGGFRERFLPGAFRDALQSGVNVRSLFNHDSNIILGDTRSKTLRLIDTPEGLRYEVDMPQTQMVQDLVADPVSRGTIAGNSFQFSVREKEDSKWEKIDGEWIRNVSRAELYEVGPVVFPAYPQTEVALRSLAEVRGTGTVLDFDAIARKLKDGQPLDESESREFQNLIQVFNQKPNDYEAAFRTRSLQLLAH